MPELILASTSVYRRQLLERLGVPFRVVAPQVDEAAIQALFDAASAADLAEHLAIAKAVSVTRQNPDAIVIGSDQVAVCGEQILNKPGTVESAREQLRHLSGKTHQLITAICVSFDGSLQVARDVASLTMRALASEEIERYVAADHPLDCAGSYKLESRGIALFEAINSADHTGIMGLPLIGLTTTLRELGLSIP
jgi:septum formation protein